MVPYCVSNRTITNFKQGLEPYLYMSYIYQKHFEKHQDSIVLQNNGTFQCRRQNYEPDNEQEIGGGTINPTANNLLLKNKNCKIQPAFKELSCYLKEESDFGTQYIWHCKNEQNTEYLFWMIIK